MMRAIVLADGSEWACERSRGESAGYGVFSRRSDGTWLQHTGTGQTPAFRKAAQLSRYVHGRYRDQYGDSLPRMVRSTGWAMAVQS